MEKRTKWIIIFVLILILLVGIFALTGGLQKKIPVGSTNFTIPSGYHEGVSNENVINLTNGKETIFITEMDTNINDAVDSYDNYLINKNYSSMRSNFTVEGTVVQKLTNLNSTNDVRYWVENNNHTYAIYSWNENPKLDSIIFDMVKDIKQTQ